MKTRFDIGMGPGVIIWLDDGEKVVLGDCYPFARLYDTDRSRQVRIVRTPSNKYVKLTIIPDEPWNVGKSIESGYHVTEILTRDEAAGLRKSWGDGQPPGIG